MLAKISKKIVLEMLFPAFSNANIEFTELRKLSLRFYTTAKALLTINRVELINKRKFAKAAVDKTLEIFVIHLLTLEVTTIYPF